MGINKRNLAWLVAAFVVAAVFAAPGASAQTLEITDEDTEAHCPSVSLSGTDVNGGCLGHAAAESAFEIRKHVFGVESHITVCSLEFWGRLDENGEGYTTESTFSGASCARQACKDVSGETESWPVHGVELGGSKEHLANVFCVEPMGGGTNESCEIDLPFVQTAVTHSVELGSATEMASHGISGFRCEIFGHWLSETGGSHDAQAEGDLVVTHLN